MTRPLLLDLFCGAGGCAVGYHRAGFDVVGVDIEPQKRYPFQMVVANALRPPFDLSTFDAIHASPPCQHFSTGSKCRADRGKGHPDLLRPTLAMLEDLVVPWVVENVELAPLPYAAKLCGRMFGLPLFRHRLFKGS